MLQRKVTLRRNGEHNAQGTLFGSDNGCGPGHRYGGLYRSYTGAWVPHGFEQVTWTEDKRCSLGEFNKRRPAKKALRKFLERK